MKKLLLLLLVCTAFSCKKDADETLVEKNWVIESATVTPAMTLGSKTSTDYLELSGPNSCAATVKLSFSKDGTFSMGSNGALCDLYAEPNAAAVTWRRDGDQVFVSSYPNSPLILSNKKLTQTTTTSTTGGTVYTIVSVFKAQSK